MTALPETGHLWSTIIVAGGVVGAISLIWRKAIRPVVNVAKKTDKFIDDTRDYGVQIASLGKTIAVLTDAANAAKATAESVRVSAEAHEAMHKDFVAYVHEFQEYVHDRFHEVDQSLTVIQGASLLHLTKLEARRKRALATAKKHAAAKKTNRRK